MKQFVISGAVALLSSGVFLSAGATEPSTSAAAWVDAEAVARLDGAIDTYRSIAAAGGWPLVPTDVELIPGTRHANVRLLRRRLRASGDYTAETNADPLSFDVTVQGALARFQSRHGLRATGIPDKFTLQALNRPVGVRLVELEHARAVRAALPATDGGRRVIVNIPDATVVALDNNEVAMTLRAVVGHPTRPTPELSSAIVRIVMNPPWNVPQSIAGADLLPLQRAQPGYFRERGFRVYEGWAADEPELDPAAIDWARVSGDRFPYRLRQDPGPHNSLGRMKFEFANAFDVYLHDTPVRTLLELNARSLSSGCVRVQDPAALAAWLLADDRKRELMQSAARDGRWRTRYVALDAPVPIDIVYLNAWVEADGTVQFRRDIYAQAELLPALPDNRRPPPTREAATPSSPPA